MRIRDNTTALRAVAKLVVMVGVLLALPGPVSACPMCKESTVETPSNDQSLNFNRSIYVMLAGLSGVVGVTGVVILKAIKSS